MLVTRPSLIASRKAFPFRLIVGTDTRPQPQRSYGWTRGVAAFVYRYARVVTSRRLRSTELRVELRGTRQFLSDAVAPGAIARIACIICHYLPLLASAMT
ncbi:hypothetical protein VDGL01_06405 [Verticillium dahliae]